MIKVGMIGLGGIGNHHMRAWAKVRGARIVAGADIAAKARSSFKKIYPEIEIFNDHETLLKKADVDAVMICTPTLSHKQIALNSMRSGRPVLTEKPMARSVADCKAMLSCAEKTGLLLMVAHCRRFDKDWGKMAEIVSKGTLGRPVLWRSVSAGTGPGSWYMDEREGGGPFLDGAVHNYDFAHQVFGDPECVVAAGIKLTPRSALDTATAVVQYRSKDQLMMNWSWGPRGGHTHDILGPRATLLFGPGDMQPQGEQGFAYYRVWPSGKDPKLIKFKYSGLDMYINEDQHFIHCLQGKAKCLTPGTESIKAVAVAEAILKAAQKGGSQKVRW